MICWSVGCSGWAMWRASSDALDNLVTKDDLKTEMTALRADMQALELRLTVKLGAFIAIAAGIIITVLKVPH